MDSLWRAGVRGCARAIGERCGVYRVGDTRACAVEASPALWMCTFGRSVPSQLQLPHPGSCTRQHLLRASLTKLTGAPLSDKNMDLIGIIQYPWKPCSIRLALSCSSVTACSRLMPLLLRPGFHAQVHLVELCN
ncbi:uncharacterized protein RBU57_007566 isoform 1-T3 [Macrochelys suwanniensis]